MRSDEVALQELDRLVERSRLIGADTELVVHGGGNTSTKTEEPDHLGRVRRVLRVKGSGTDLRTIGSDGFPGLWLDELSPLRELDAMTDDQMVAYLARSLVDPGSRRPSIETLLHAFLPATHVDHVHADAICALTNTPNAQQIVREALGDDIAFVEWVRPGFTLSKRVGEMASSRAVVLGHHGLVTWGATHEESYKLTLELVAGAEAYLAAHGTPVRGEAPDMQDEDDVLVALRGRLSHRTHKVLHVDRSQRSLADRPDADKIVGAGAATADHILRLRTGSVLGLASIDEYERAYPLYFERHKGRLEGPYEMHEPLPRAFLVPGLGCIGQARDAHEARVTTDVALHTHLVAARVLDAFGEAEPLSEEDVFDVDFWGLELYKLTLSPPPAELAGRIMIVTGAATGIGKQVANVLGSRGAHLILADLDEDGLGSTAGALDPERTRAVAGDLTDERVVDQVVREAIRSFGGVDGAVLNAGIGAAATLADATPELWNRSMDVNAGSHFLLTRRLWPVLERQGIGGSLVYVVSKNAFAPGAGFGPYSAAKAAQMQLMRIAALEGGKIGVRANAVNPDAVFGDSKLWSQELREARAKAHGVKPNELEDFYASRNLLGVHVRAADVAEAVAFLMSDRARATTGGVLSVDGGVAMAFPR